MTIGNAASGHYIRNQDTSTPFIAPAIRLGLINMPSFCFLLGADNTTAGFMLIEVANSTNNNFGPEFDALVWVPVAVIPIVAGLFPVPNLPAPFNVASKSYMWPDSAVETNEIGPWLTAAEAIRLRYAFTGGGSANQLNVAYFGKSFG